MTNPRPKLVAVEAPDEAPNVEPVPDRRSAFWVLLVLVAICALVAAFQTQRVDALNSEVASLEAHLAASQAALEAYQGQMDDVRSAVTDLQSQLGALDELVRRDPTQPD